MNFRRIQMKYRPGFLHPAALTLTGITYDNSVWRRSVVECEVGWTDFLAWVNEGRTQRGEDALIDAGAATYDEMNRFLRTYGMQVGFIFKPPKGPE